MNNLTKIIHKLEEECQEIAENIFINKDYSLPGWFEIYDLYQSIISILEKTERTDKIVKNICEVCQYLSVSAPPLVTNAECRTFWYQGIDYFKKYLLERIREIIWREN